MNWEKFQTLESFDEYGPLLARGQERFCFVSRKDPFRCVKVSPRDSDVQTIREIRYFEFLERRGIKADFLPAYYGSFQNANFVGFEQECFGAERAEQLIHYLRRATLPEIEAVERALEPLLQDMIRTNVIVSDLHAANILRVTDNGSVRYVVIDGYGSPEWIPLPNYCRFFGRRKIQRQWRKFMERWKQLKSTLPAVRGLQSNSES